LSLHLDNFLYINHLKILDSIVYASILNELRSLFFNYVE